MAVIYGVLRGKLDRWKREDPPPGASKSPHLQIRLLDSQGKPWRVPVNVRSGDPTKSLVIFHRADPLLGHPILDSLAALPSGLTDLNNKPRSASNALDYSRAPLFDWPTGIALPPTAPGEDDDLQDVVSRQLERRDARHPHEPGQPTRIVRRRQRCLQRWRAHPQVSRPRHWSVLPLQDAVPPDRRARQSDSGCLERDSAGRRGLRSGRAGGERHGTLAGTAWVVFEGGAGA